jgi:tetratricopeptide (TPR) repeat protein
MEKIFDELKNNGDDNLKNENYNAALDFYSEALELGKFEKTYAVYLNRCLAYFKLEKYDKALDDAYKASVIKPDSAKAWGRVGSCLLALNKKEESYEAFYKASQLEPTNEHYKSLCKTENLDQLIEELKELKKNKVEMPKPSIEGLLGPLFSKMMNNKKLIQLATNPSFNLAKYKDNPLDAMNNPDIMDLVSDVLGELNMNKKN